MSALFGLRIVPLSDTFSSVLKHRTEVWTNLTLSPPKHVGGPGMHGGVQAERVVEGAGLLALEAWFRAPVSLPLLRGWCAEQACLKVQLGRGRASVPCTPARDA